MSGSSVIARQRFAPAVNTGTPWPTRCAPLVCTAYDLAVVAKTGIYSSAGETTKAYCAPGWTLVSRNKAVMMSWLLGQPLVVLRGVRTPDNSSSAPTTIATNAFRSSKFAMNPSEDNAVKSFAGDLLNQRWRLAVSLA